MSRQAQFESGVPVRSVLTQSPELPLHPGDEVDGRYIVDAIIGTGGVGIVVSARHKKLNERVAIKFLQSTAMLSEENVLRFEREARAAARIKSEHVSRVMDFGVLESGAPYMVLEYLEGSDLAQAMASSGPLPYSVAVDTLVQVCEGVVHAHAAGIVHRDLKPANLFLTKRADGTAIVKVLDFGISKLTSDDEVTLTQATSVIGSPMYMSPEQIVSPRDADRQSDLWSLGVILYELIAGRPPFSGKSMGGLCAAICQGHVDPLGVEVPPELEAILMRCLQKDRKDRIGSAVELAAALAPFGTQESARMLQAILRLGDQHGMRVETQVVDPASVADETPSGARPVSFPPDHRATAPRPARNRIVLGALVGATLLGLIGAGAYGLVARVDGTASSWAERRLETSILRMRSAAVAPVVAGAGEVVASMTDTDPFMDHPLFDDPIDEIPDGVEVEVEAAPEATPDRASPPEAVPASPRRDGRPRPRTNGRSTKPTVTAAPAAQNPLDVLSER